MKLLCLNFKMNLLKKDVLKYLKCIDNKIDKDNIIFFPSIPYIELFTKENYLVGSQDISFKDFGSFTGDTSIEQLKELGIKYTLIGHSERRKYFDDDKYISKKIKLAVENNIIPILCIGEELKGDQSETNAILKEKLDEVIIENLILLNNDNLIIAYEPIWAIGSDIIPNNNDLKNTISFIDNYLINTYNLHLKILYGGSVNLDTLDSLEKIKELDGYLIGSFSLKPENVLAISKKIM